MEDWKKDMIEHRKEEVVEDGRKMYNEVWTDVTDE